MSLGVIFRSEGKAKNSDLSSFLSLVLEAYTSVIVVRYQVTIFVNKHCDQRVNLFVCVERKGQGHEAMYSPYSDRIKKHHSEGVGRNMY